MSSLPGVGDRVAGRFELLEAREQCGAYAAYRALDREVEVEVALWAMRRALFSSVEQMDTFVGVAVEMRDISHRNLLRVFDAGHDGEQVFVTMQLSGENLDGRLESGERASLAELVEKATSIAEALDLVHRLGYVHGRMAPRSVSSVADLTKLSGVGLFAACSAKEVDWHADASFAAPEVRRGAAPTAAADVYSLGALLLCLAAGRRTVEEAVAELGQGAVVDSLRPALADLPASRPRTAGALALAFKQSVVDDRVPTTQRPSQPVAPGLSTVIDAGPLDMGHDLQPAGDELPTAIDAPSFPMSHPSRPGEETRDESLDDDETQHYLRIDEGLASQPDPDLDDDGGGAATVADAEPASGLASPEVPPFFQAGLGNPDVVASSSEPPPGTPAHDTGAVDAVQSSAAPRFVSMKDDPPARARGGATPLLPVGDRPDLRPAPTDPARSVDHVTPGTGERLAPPRDDNRSGRSRATRAIAILVAALVVIGSAVAAILLAGGDNDDDRPAVADAAAVVPAAELVMDAAPPQPAGPCPAGMVLLEGYCIDAHESPGAGRLPETGVTAARAAEACRERSARLCSPEEWEGACRAKGTASWPYGDAFRADLCNLNSGEVTPAGARPDCKTEAGVFDLSGNVAEWDASGEIRGGSAVDETRGRCSQRRPNPGRQSTYSDVGYRCCADPLESAGAAR